MRKFLYGLIAASLLIFSVGTARGDGLPGDFKWFYTTGNSIERSSPAIGPDGTIYIGSGDTYLHAVAPDGNVKWTFQTGDRIASSPAIGPDGTIYVGSYDHFVYAISPNGDQKWKTETDGPISSSPAIGADGTIYVGSDDYKLYALDADSGTLKWPQPYLTHGPISSSPAIGADGTIYVGASEFVYTEVLYGLYAINPNTGVPQWFYPMGESVSSSPAIGADGTIYVGSDDHFLYAIRPTGTLKWKKETGDVISSSPAIGADGTIYVGSGGVKLYAFSSNGTFKWSFRTNNSVNSSSAIGADGTIYVGSYDQCLYAILPSSSSKWPEPYCTGGPISSSPAIAPDGTVYVGSEDGKLYAIYSSSMGLAKSPWPMFHRGPNHMGNVQALLTVVPTGVGTGKVTSSSPGIDCGSTCSLFYKRNAKVSLTPAPDKGSVFAGWTGGCKGNGACSITMSGDITVGATFDVTSCAYAITSPGKTLTYKGGKITIGVTAKPYTYCNPPEITDLPAWVTYTTSFAKNRGSIVLTVPKFENSAGRDGTFFIAKDSLEKYSFKVTQTGEPCNVTLTPIRSDVLPKAGWSGSFTVSAPDNCSWSAAPDVKSLWVHATAGIGKVDYTVDQNPGAATRTGAIIITYGPTNKTKSFPVTQGGK